MDRKVYGSGVGCSLFFSQMVIDLTRFKWILCKSAEFLLSIGFEEKLIHHPFYHLRMIKCKVVTECGFMMDLIYY